MPPALRPRTAILLLGPTGSGKTPLGDLIEARGLWGARCRHFDFGANLRRLVEDDRPVGHVTREDLDFLRDVLRTGALLEDRHFPLAARILDAFLSRSGADAGTVIVLNGLPRHAGQAEGVGKLLEVRAVVHLACPPEVVLQRIRANTGGDRADRPDDDLESVRNKLAIYAERTAPLLAFYHARGVAVHTLEVTTAMTPDEAWCQLEAWHS